MFVNKIQQRILAPFITR